MAVVYKHPYDPVSVYGNVLSLLREGRIGPGIHIDVGCGYGAIAEPIREELGREYLGFDSAEDGLEDLRQRGFATWRIDLSNLDQAEATIRAAIGDRPLASITLTDVLEHLTNGAATLAMLRRLAGSDVDFVLSVPNVAHKDVALKLLLGRWDVTEAGLLDHTHVDFYTGPRLRETMARLGWREVGSRDWRLERSDQFFPADSPVLNQGVPLGHLLRRIVDGAHPHAIVNQFVRAFRPTEPEQSPEFAQAAGAAGSFLSVLVLGSDRGSEETGLTWRALLGQDDQDFEVIALTTAEGGEEQLALPDALRTKTRTLGGSANPSEALNQALDHASGAYVAIVRAGDELAPNWVSTFAELRQRASGAVLRAGLDPAVLDPSRPDLLPDIPLFLPDRVIGASHGIAEYAVPRAAAISLGLRFQPELLTGAEYDWVTQANLLCGLAVSPVVTAKARLARSGEATVTEQDRLRVLERLNAHPTVLPPGGAERLNRLACERDWLAGDHDRLVRAVDDLAHERDRLAREVDRLSAFHENLRRSADDMGETLRRSAPARDLIARAPLLAALMDWYRPGLIQSTPAADGARDNEQPFLSIITRTQGARPRTLHDVLLTLAGQSCPSFEHLIMVHNKDEQVVQATRELVAEFPTSLRSRVRVLQCIRPGRSAPLNDALEVARGRYVSVLDDDDMVFSHWVEIFQTLAAERPGSVVRAVCTRQDFAVGDKQKPRATSWFTMPWPTEYDAVRHLYDNHTPFMSVAYPRAAIDELGLRFDETLTTIEDWDFTTRLATLCGVNASPEVTAIYRWWTDGESSAFLHEEAEWKANHAKVLDKLNGQPVLLPPGSVATVAGLYKLRDDQQDRIAAQDWEIAHQRRRLIAMEEEAIQQGKMVAARERQVEASVRLAEKQLGRRGLSRIWSSSDREPDYRAIKTLASGFFDPEWYLERNPDVQAGGGDALEHFVLHGMAEHRDPGPGFNSAQYLALYPDVEAAGVPPFLHFIRHGRSEGRTASAADDRTALAAEVLESGLFDPQWYLNRHPDVRADGADPIEHFVRFGMIEGRDPGPRFDSSGYLAANSDVAASRSPPFLHYLRFGKAEGRQGGARSSSEV